MDQTCYYGQKRMQSVLQLSKQNPPILWEFNVSKRLRNSVLILYKIPLRERHYYTTMVCAHAPIEKKNEAEDIIGDFIPRAGENVFPNSIGSDEVSTPRLTETDLVSRRI
ncbi:hypothetical protein TNIN_227411 [Trichonephila inaurata madagascariensis]|uniref:Uncharacterized protein n=1 Tax=Trichonephila inaurata madagascariensis TaxID=2747483 RepID=A0A8X6YDD8_9ARAC|nr:hypothetical protein TNIN_227411 [Trichonephila inaurata madagascariensis]